VHWARLRIEQLMAGYRGASVTERDGLRQQVVEVALAHQLVSRFTSLVAIEQTPTRPEGNPQQAQPVATNLPAGWTYERVFGMPQTATPATLQIVVGLLLLMTAWLLRRRLTP
jgi:Ca-activated chloride channel family protein